MTYQRVDSLCHRWMDLGVLAALEIELEKIGFTDQYVDAMIALGGTPRAPTKSKVIKDEIWGMIDVEQSCLRLLDSPILQHLRGVRQNGFSYLTYPPAEHTRFTHSLGMMSVVSRFLDAIIKRSNDGQPPGSAFQPWRPDAAWSHLLQHAALVHDIGHMPFSHVTEAIVEGDPGLFFVGQFQSKIFYLR